MNPGRAFVLNLDAEYELEAGKRYAPTRHVAQLVQRESQRLHGTLLGPHDVVVSERALEAGGPGIEAARGLRGVAWSPTPRALGLLARAGARVEAAPDVETLREVNARPFAAAVLASLEHDALAKSIVTQEDQALAKLARPASLGWLVRRTFGAAGRGRRRLYAGRPSEHELAWIRAGLRRGPLVIEPWVVVTREYTRSGLVRRDGTVALSAPCLQETHSSGAWLSTERASRGAVSREDDAVLEEATARAGERLAQAGYFGPFGIDAFRYRARLGGGDVLQPMSEINARLTMDWSTAMLDTSELGV